MTSHSLGVFLKIHYPQVFQGSLGYNKVTRATSAFHARETVLGQIKRL